jgi:hypothetical protein
MRPLREEELRSLDFHRGPSAYPAVSTGVIAIIVWCYVAFGITLTPSTQLRGTVIGVDERILLLRATVEGPVNFLPGQELKMVTGASCREEGMRILDVRAVSQKASSGTAGVVISLLPASERCAFRPGSVLELERAGRGFTIAELLLAKV